MEQLKPWALPGGVAGIILAVYTSGIFMTKTEGTALADNLRLEQAQNYVQKTDLREVLNSLKVIEEKVELIRINEARGRR